MVEKIVCAALHWDDGKERLHQPKNITTGLVVCGLRHGDCFVVLREITTTGNKWRPIQGFLTTKNRFVDRNEAAKIAFKADQTNRDVMALFSEDLY